MLSSMYAGVSGLRVHQTKLDVIGNNIANINTVAFKHSTISFKEVFSQTLSSAEPPSINGTGGKNPSQIGLGTTIGSVTTIHTRGNIQPTGNPNDLAIEGNGFFVVNNGVSTMYTRAGNFTVDTQGNLVTVNGERVMGWNQGNSSVIDISRPLEAINLSNLKMPAKATTEIHFEGNLDSRTENYVAGPPEENAIDYNITIYDSLGDAHTLTFKFMKTAANTYSYSVTSDDPTMTITAGGTGGSITFDNNGKISNRTIPNLTLSFNSGAANVNIASSNIRFDNEKFTQFSNATKITGRQDGYQAGTLDNLSIDREGRVIGRFTNGRQDHVATIALASFINPAGLEKVGNNLFAITWNSGDADIGVGGTGERGVITSNALEMSNVDLSKEFTEMIVAQRGFQANSRIISVSDEVLQELVNLKR